MSRKITIKIASLEVEAELNESNTANALWEALPIESTANTWGDEIYFSVPVTVGLEDGQEVVEAGDVAYWPPGKALCIFFGATPASRGSEIRAASAVNVCGKVLGDPRVLTAVNDGGEVSISRVR